MPTNLEIERKFVVNTSHPEWLKIRETMPGQRLIQSTIHKESGYKLRIRIIEDLATGARSSFFCFKVNKAKDHHLDPSVRDEYEWPVQDRNALYMMIGHGEVSKIRREWTDDTGLHWAIDEYEGSNAGVVTVDVEMSHKNHTFQKPSWCGWEVTSDERLKNSSLQDETKAFSTWSSEMKSWYESLMVGDGISVYPSPDVAKKKTRFLSRLKLAWRVLRGGNGG